MESMVCQSKAKGEITAFLSLVFLLLLAFTGSIIESASIQISKNYKKADMVRAMESVFAEYHRDLLEDYEVFALDGSYGKKEFTYENLTERLWHYGASSIENEVKRIEYLTDHSGQPFYNQVMTYMGTVTGLDKLDGLAENSEVWKEQEENSQQYEQLDETTNEQLQTELEAAEKQLQDEDNPLKNISGLKQSPLLYQVMEDPSTVSERRLELADQPSHRQNRKGEGSFPAKDNGLGIPGTFLLGEYLLTHFSNALESSEETAMGYEIEYLIAGKESDRENLEAILAKLLLVRFGINYAYLLTDSVKQGEAEALALALTTLIALPELVELAKQALLLAWAYGETIMDLRTLMRGHKVPIVKSSETWSLSLSGLKKLGTSEDTKEGTDSENGLDYKGYLRVLLVLEAKETLSMRCLDLIESNMRLKGQSYFRVDSCVTNLEMTSTCRLRRGINYQFQTVYGYQ